jgi:hypothetical protein
MVELNNHFWGNTVLFFKSEAEIMKAMLAPTRIIPRK